MDEAVKEQAKDEMHIILELLEEWALKYREDYVTAYTFVYPDRISSSGSTGNYPEFDVTRNKERAPVNEAAASGRSVVYDMGILKKQKMI